MTDPNVPGIIEFDLATAIREISAAWDNYKTHGLAFGQVLAEWRDKFKSKGGYGSQGKGLVQVLDESPIPKSTPYFWISQFEISIGEKPPKDKPYLEPDQHLSIQAGGEYRIDIPVDHDRVNRGYTGPLIITGKEITALIDTHYLKDKAKREELLASQARLASQAATTADSGESKARQAQ